MSAAERRESIERALVHHDLAGVVHTWSPPEPVHHDPARKGKWTITLTSHTLDPIVCSTPAALDICKALAGAEWALVRRHGIADVGKLLDVVRELVDACTGVSMLADDSAAFERAEAALIAAKRQLGGVS